MAAKKRRSNADTLVSKEEFRSRSTRRKALIAPPRKPTHFRNSLNRRDKVQIEILRKRLKLTDERFTSVLRKLGISISAIAKEASTLKQRTSAHEDRTCLAMQLSVVSIVRPIVPVAQLRQMLPDSSAYRQRYSARATGSRGANMAGLLTAGRSSLIEHQPSALMQISTRASLCARYGLFVPPL